MLSKLLAFLGPAPLKGYVNGKELGKTLLTATVAGLIATAIGDVIAVQADPNIFDPKVAGFAAYALTQLLDFLRRLQHGSDIPA